MRTENRDLICVVWQVIVYEFYGTRKSSGIVLLLPKEEKMITTWG